MSNNRSPVENVTGCTHQFAEYTLTYPAEWEQEYVTNRYVLLWRERYPDQFEPWIQSTMPGTLDLFPQYALMFLLRDQQDVRSITWYELAATSKTSKNMERRQKYWGIMREFMGEEKFCLLQQRTRGVRGEPDLFCWQPTTGLWFFAEAKRKDELSEHQIEWCSICKQCLGELTDIRLYWLRKDR